MQLSEWEAISKIAAALLVPLVLAGIGHVVTRAVKEREIQGRFVELALTILKEQPTEANRNLRVWATRVVDRYSGIPLSAEAREDLIARVPLTIEALTLTGVESKYTVPSTARTIDQVIISDAQLPDLPSAVAALEHPDVRGVYHYLIDRDGSTYRMVDEANVAHHSGRSNRRSIGIGLVHRSGEGDYPDLQREALVELLADIARRRRIAMDGIVAKSEVMPGKRSDLARAMDELRREVAARMGAA